MNIWTPETETKDNSYKPVFSIHFKKIKIIWRFGLDYIFSPWNINLMICNQNSELSWLKVFIIFAHAWLKYAYQYITWGNYEVFANSFIFSKALDTLDRNISIQN